MYRLNIRRHFDSAHYLRGYNGKCENLHGHRWHVVVSLAGHDLNDIGIMVDFKIMKRHLDDILSYYDHKLLNDMSEFAEVNPSTENLSRVIYEKLLPHLPEKTKLEKVEVWETPDTWTCYSQDA